LYSLDFGLTFEAVFIPKTVVLSHLLGTVRLYAFPFLFTKIIFGLKACPLKFLSSAFVFSFCFYARFRNTFWLGKLVCSNLF